MKIQIHVNVKQDILVLIRQQIVQNVINNVYNAKIQVLTVYLVMESIEIMQQYQIVSKI